MTKTPRMTHLIESNRRTITQMLSGAEFKRLNNVNWLRHDISYAEPRMLFHMPAKKQAPYLDFNCMTNIGFAYDYILANHNIGVIDEREICGIHASLCMNTYISGGMYRTANKLLEISVKHQRMSAPDAYEIPSRMSQIVAKINNARIPVLKRAFDAHYDIIALQPFDDFNKRTARLIMNWVLIRGGYRPIVFNKLADKENYRMAIAQYASGNPKGYYAYMSECLLRTQYQIIKKLRQAKIYQNG